MAQASRTIAIIGASSDPRKFGNRALRAFRRQGYTVIPINPNEAQVEGLKAYSSVLDVPGTIDMATFYVPPEIGEKVIAEVARKRIPEVWLNPGSESDELIRLARALNVEPILACSILGIGENPYS
jgi:predicted CoA-binding protein